VTTQLNALLLKLTNYYVVSGR